MDRKHQTHLLKNETRRLVYDYVKNNPAACVRDVILHGVGPGRVGQTVYALDKLVKAQVLCVRRVGKFKCYYDPLVIPPDARVGIAVDRYNIPTHVLGNGAGGVAPA